jgi:hypothetical protein
MEQPTQSNQGDDKSLTAPSEMLQPLSRPAGGDAVAAKLSEGDKQSITPSVGLTAADYHPKFAEEIHNYLREYVRNADQKAAFFFTGSTAVLAFLHTRKGTAHWLKPVATWSVVDALVFLAMFSLAISAGTLLTVVFPRLKGSKRGLIFFSAIVEYDSSREYAEEVLRKSIDEIVSAKLRHSYDLACVCVSKYRTLRIGFWIGSVGIISALLFLLLSPGEL